VDQLNTYATEFVRVHIVVLPGIRLPDIPPCSGLPHRKAEFFIPSTPANIYEDFLKRHGEGIQHIGMPVDDLSKATAAYEKLGFPVWQAGAWGDIGKPDSGQYHYMHTDKIGGVSVELIHAY
jgi:hypothetical protein